MRKNARRSVEISLGKRAGEPRFTLVFLALGLVFALLVNYVYYFRYYTTLDPGVIEAWEAIGSSNDFGDAVPDYLPVRLLWMDRAITAVAGGEPVGFEDHEMALYFYGAACARGLGMTRGWQVFLFLQMAGASLVLLFYPFLVYAVTGSRVAALVTPVAVHGLCAGVLYAAKSDTYWAYAWVVVLAVPLFALFARRGWDVKKWLLCGALAFVAAAGSVVRSHAGLPVLALLVLCLGRDAFAAARRKNFAGLVAPVLALVVFLGAGFVCSTGIPTLFFAKYGYVDFDFPPWHTLYIGLGYGPNPYGIEYVDAIGELHAQRIDPATFYARDGVSPDSYFSILKSEYFRIMRDDPAFFFSVYARKAFGAVMVGVSHFFSGRRGPVFVWGALAVLFVFLVYRGIVRKRVSALFDSCGPFFWGAFVCALVGIIPGLIAFPLPMYLYGFLYALSVGALGVVFCAVKGLGAVCVCLGARAKENAVRDVPYDLAGGEGGESTAVMPVIALVVPCFNEEDALPSAVAELSGVLTRLVSGGAVSEKSFLLFVDDGSRDTTWALIKQFHASNPCRVRGIKLAANRGQQNALFAGLMEARECADAVISIDADLQDDSGAIDAMVETYCRGAEIVYGVRAGRASDSVFKRTSARVFYRLMRFIGAEIVYDHADFRLMGKESLDALAEYGEVNLFLRGIIPTLGFKSGAVFYDRKERRAGSSKYPVGNMLHFAFEGITSFSIKPIRVISVLGASIFVASLVMIIYFFARYFSGNTVTGWASIACSIWGIGGLILLSVGVIGEYIGKIYLEAKRRPRYRIEERLAVKEVPQS